MLIDLSTPQIKFGSGKFEVSDQGHLTARGGGSIAGWNIGETQLQSVSKSITLEAGNSDNDENKIQAAIYSNSHSSFQDSSGDGFYLSEKGLSIGSKIKISKDGTMYIGSGAVKKGGKEEVENPNYWTIHGKGSGEKESSYISYNTTSRKTGSNSVYLGTDGISLGTKFEVTNAGVLTAESGKIANWTITDTKLTSQKNENKYIEMSSNGNIGCYDSKNMYWEISNSGTATFKRATIEGNVTATSGSIGGWTINGNQLKSTAGTLILDSSSASITGTGWNIAGNGTVKFTKGNFGPWTVNTMGKGKEDENAFRGSTGNKSILIKANGDIIGSNISNSRKSDYWQIVDCKAEFTNGLYIGIRTGNDNNDKGWRIRSNKNNKTPLIFSYDSQAKIQFGPGSSSASVGYTTKDKKGTISLSRALIEDKLYGTSAEFSDTVNIKTLKIWHNNSNKYLTLWEYLNTVLDDVAFGGKYSQLSGTPKLAKVATSGSYKDLSDKPSAKKVSITIDGKTGSSSDSFFYD